MRSQRICLTTSYTSDFRDLGDYAAMTLHYYAARYGFSDHVETQSSFERPPSWRKIKLIAELFERGYQFVLWIDADAVFVRFDADIRDQIRPRSDLYIVRHTYENAGNVITVPNAGVMLWRNCAWSREFLGRVWAMDRFAEHPWWENAALINLMGFDSLLGEGPDHPDEAVLEHICFLPLEWNTLPIRTPLPSPIVKHYAGEPLELRRREIPRDALASCFNALADTCNSQHKRTRWPGLLGRSGGN